jgi:hypothetical protein
VVERGRAADVQLQPGAQPGDGDVHRRAAAVGRLVAPDRPQQPLRRQGAAVGEQQQAEQRPAGAGGRGQRPLAGPHDQRAEHLEADALVRFPGHDQTLHARRCGSAAGRLRHGSAHLPRTARC